MVTIEEVVREICVGKSRLYLGKDNILYIYPYEGVMDEKKAIGASRASLKLMNMIDGRVNALIDLNKAGKQSPEARKIWQKWNDNGKTGKVAYIGMHPVARILAAFVIGVSRNKDNRFFQTKEKALTWLKE